MALRCYRVTTTFTTLLVMACCLADAIQVGLELSGPGSTLLSCLEEGDW